MSQFIYSDFVLAAQRFPDRTAVWSDQETLTYRELYLRSLAFAHWLLQRGLAPGNRCAIILPKCVDAVVALLGSMMAGNAYVPLGATWPESRIDKIIDGGDFTVLVVEDGFDPNRAGQATVLSNTGNDWKAATVGQPKSDMALPQLKLSDLAYILYTSGSTGVPKGVCVSHGSAHFFPAWARRQFGLDHNDRIASIAPFTFDLSTFDLFSGLASGAAIYLVPEKEKLLPSRYSQFLQDHGITIIYAVPSTLSLLAQRGRLADRDLSRFKTVLFAGEVFPPLLCRLFIEQLPKHVRFYNLYGPTETNVCTYYQVTLENLNDGGIPIGKPLPDTNLFVMDDHGAVEKDSDSIGELCVAGPTVMSAYWGEKEQEDTHWLNLDEVGLACGVYTKAYKTGDIVKKGRDGEWMYYGRRDKMVKIWGYRVELGEIETCLLKHANVEQCAVVKRSKQNGFGEELVAFIVLNNSLELNDLFAYCKQHLPHYMVPNQIQELLELPYNHSGKIDRLKLEELSLAEEVTT